MRVLTKKEPDFKSSSFVYNDFWYVLFINIDKPNYIFLISAPGITIIIRKPLGDFEIRY